MTNIVRDLFALNRSIQEVFGVKIALTSTMQELQSEWRNIVAGEAPWNNKDTRSLLLADAVAGEIASRVSLGLKCEVSGSVRADYINEQLKPIIDELQYTVAAVCNGGEAIYKPYMTADGIEVTLVETDSYWPIGYNTRNELIDVIFGAVYQTDRYIYRLLERQLYDAETQTHAIEYRAFKAEQTGHGFTPENIGRPVELAEVPDWAQLQNIIIQGIESPLFVVIKAPPTKVFEKPQRQGVPVWAKAVDMLKKADEHEARTAWEFFGSELAVDVSDDHLESTGSNRPGEKKKAKLSLPQREQRLFRKHNVGALEQPLTVFNPEPRIAAYAHRMNDIMRRIEFLSGLSYGIISDNNMVEKTAEEFRSSKERLVTTVSGIQRDTMQPALEHLIDSFNVLADLQLIPYGVYESTFDWSESYALDRQAEVSERFTLLNGGALFLDEFRAYYNEVTLDEARKELEERGVPWNPVVNEYNAPT